MDSMRVWRDRLEASFAQEWRVSALARASGRIRDTRS